MLQWREKDPMTVSFLERVKRELEEGKPSMEIMKASYGHDMKALERLGSLALVKDYEYTMRQIGRMKVVGKFEETPLPEILNRLNEKQLDELLISKEEILMWDAYNTMMETYAEAVKEAQIEAYEKDFLETLNIEDFPSLRAHMKKKGLVISAVQCPQCGAPLKLPESGREIICDYCKTTLYANEIFKKIKRF